MRRVNDEDIRPFNELLQHLSGVWRFQVQRDSALVAVGEVPWIGIFGDRLWRQLVRMSPQFAARRLHFDDVGTEVGQDHRGLGPAMKLAKSTTFNPEKILSLVITIPSESLAAVSSTLKLGCAFLEEGGGA